MENHKKRSPSVRVLDRKFKKKARPTRMATIKKDGNNKCW